MTVAAQSSQQKAMERQDGSAQTRSLPAVPAIPNELIQDLVKMLKLVSDETRLRILFHLAQNEELHVRALCELLKQSQPAVSHHLAMLRVAGVVDRRRDGKHNFYRVVPGHFDRLLALVFDAVGDDDRIQFNNYEISYRPPVRPK